MAIDVTQFHQAFFEESLEGLDLMESALLSLDMGAPDMEAVNTIFRAAHSIKGGSGTFGFNAVADFTHVLETLLDEMRDGKRQVSQELVDAVQGKETGIACSQVPIGGGANADNIRRCIEFLKQTDWSGVLSIECYGTDDNIRRSVEFLRDLLR